MADYKDAIWKLLWNYIANESPDYDYEDIGEELCERILPQVWDNVQKLGDYADKLADGLPEGMLPKDIELVKQANAEMATELLALQKQVEGLREALRVDWEIIVDELEQGSTKQYAIQSWNKQGKALQGGE